MSPVINSYELQIVTSMYLSLSYFINCMNEIMDYCTAYSILKHPLFSLPDTASVSLAYCTYVGDADMPASRRLRSCGKMVENLMPSLTLVCQTSTALVRVAIRSFAFPQGFPTLLCTVENGVFQLGLRLND